MPEGRIRVIALAVIQHRDRLLVFEGNDSFDGTRFYRPLGGGIEFGEYGSDAVARELQEEIGVELADVRYLGMVENMFTYNGQPYHEMVLLYSAQFADRSLYDCEEFDGAEANGARLKGLWISLAECESGSKLLVPEALLEFLKRDGPVA